MENYGCGCVWAVPENFSSFRRKGMGVWGWGQCPTMCQNWKLRANKPLDWELPFRLDPIEEVVMQILLNLARSATKETKLL